MKESLDCDCEICSICNGLRRPNESHEDAALRRGTQPTDVQQLKAEIAAVADMIEKGYAGYKDEYFCHRPTVIAKLRQLSAV